MKSNKILIIAAHPDDEILGCAGTIARMVNEGCVAYTIILGEGITSRGEIRQRNKRENEILGLKVHLNNKANKAIGVKKVFIYDFPVMKRI